MISLPERMKRAATVLAVEALERTVQALLIENLPRGSILPMPFVERARIMKAALDVENLSRQRNEPAHVKAYEAARDLMLSYVTPTGLIALCAFRGEQGPATMSFLSALDPRLKEAAGKLGEFVALVRGDETKADLVGKSRHLARAALAGLECATAGSWCTDLPTVIRRIAKERDEALAEVERWREWVSKASKPDEDASDASADGG